MPLLGSRYARTARLSTRAINKLRFAAENQGATAASRRLPESLGQLRPYHKPILTRSCSAPAHTTARCRVRSWHCASRHQLGLNRTSQRCGSTRLTDSDIDRVANVAPALSSRNASLG